jgi:glycosyltransferase involved in cell wall biosynthesis
MKKILVISHDASLTGAPILLLHALRMLKDRYEFTIILKKGGVLENEFKEIASTFILKHKKYSERNSPFLMIWDRIRYLIRQLKVVPLFYRTEIILSNTIANGRLLYRFRFFKKPVITYVHELESVLNYFTRSNDTQFSFKLTSIFLFPSLAVKKNLVENHAIPDKKLNYFPYYFPAQNFTFSPQTKQQFRLDLIRKWKLPETAKIVVGMGVVSLRKGTDKFIEISQKAFEKDENVFFFWIGDFVSTPFSQEIKSNYYNRMYNDRIIFTGKIQYAYSNLLAYDLFFLSSVEDPYPLVVLEAAYQQVPALCFRSSGGIAELLDDGNGYIIENDSTDQAADSIISLLNDRDDLVTKGIRVQEKVISLHSDQNNISNIFDKVVGSILK